MPTMTTASSSTNPCHAANVLSSILHNDLDLLGDRVLYTEGVERLEYWKAFEKLWNAFPNKNVPYGRIHNRRHMCSILAVLTIDGLLLDGVELPPSLPGAPMLFLSLAEWAEENWQDLAVRLQDLATDLMRKDASADATEPENNHVDGIRGRSNVFATKFERVLRMLRLHKALACVRTTLSEQLQDDSLPQDQPPTVDAKLVKRFVQKVENEEDATVQEALWQLLNENKSQFRSLRDLKPAFQHKPFCFSLFLNKTNTLLQMWAEVTLEAPLLTHVYFPQDDKDEIVKQQPIQALQQLRRARVALNESGDDPLQDAIRLASTAGGRPPESEDDNENDKEQASSPPLRRSTRNKSAGSGGSALYRKKRSATRMQFTPQDDEELLSEPGEENVAVGLSELPTHPPPHSSRRGGDALSSDGSAYKRPRKSQEKSYQGRRQFTDEEKRAIREGIRAKGLGKWAEIKNEYQVILNDRTSQQIKDCFRTMKKRNELGDLADVLQVEENI